MNQQKVKQLWHDIEQENLAFLTRCDDLIAKLGGDETDSRPAAFMRLRAVGRTIAILPIRANLLVEHAEGVQLLMTLWGRGQADVPILVRDLDLHAKISFIALGQFYLENMLQTVLEQHPKAKKASGFYQAAEEILRVANVPDIATKLEVLNVLAKLRNTMHREGIHTKADYDITIGKMKYEFRKRKAVLCSSWSHVYNAMQASLDIYDEILCSKEIQSLKHVPLVVV